MSYIRSPLVRFVAIRSANKWDRRHYVLGCPSVCVCQTWNWVIGSPGQWVIFHVRVTGSPGHHFDPMRPEFFRFSKKCPKRKTYIWNAEMTRVIVRCLLMDWNHWMSLSVHAMNFYFYLWLLKILWPENTFSHISRHLEFIVEQGHRVNWVSGSLDSRVTGSLGHKMWPSSICGVCSTKYTRVRRPGGGISACCRLLVYRPTSKNCKTNSQQVCATNRSKRVWKRTIFELW